jgi:clathrin heavy chain
VQFVDIGSRECYVGMMYACYDLLKPDVVLEMSWRNGLHDFTMVSFFASLKRGFWLMM